MIAENQSSCAKNQRPTNSRNFLPGNSRENGVAFSDCFGPDLVIVEKNLILSFFHDGFCVRQYILTTCLYRGIEKKKTDDALCCQQYTKPSYALFPH